MNNHITIVFIILIGIVLFILLFTNCNKKIYNRPVWPCPYNENRLKHLYIKESSSKYTSQSLFDPYSFTHISHGILLFYILYFINGYKKYNSMIYIALLFEILWEIIENTPMIINKYRKVNKNSRDYPGDSIINSIGDIISMCIGFYLSWYNPNYGFIILVLNEIGLYYYMNDDIIMEVYQLFIQ